MGGAGSGRRPGGDTKAATARALALNELIARHADEWIELYRRVRVQYGLTPDPEEKKAAVAAKLREQLRAAGIEPIA